MAQVLTDHWLQKTNSDKSLKTKVVN